MISPILVGSISATLIVWLYRHLPEKKKYQQTAYLSNLKQAVEFIEMIEGLDDYVTWIHRDKINRNSCRYQIPYSPQV